MSKRSTRSRSRARIAKDLLEDNLLLGVDAFRAFTFDGNNASVSGLDPLMLDEGSGEEKAIAFLSKIFARGVVQ